MEPTPSRPT